jgi:hypothetical protein
MAMDSAGFRIGWAGRALGFAGLGVCWLRSVLTMCWPWPGLGMGLSSDGLVWSWVCLGWAGSGLRIVCAVLGTGLYLSWSMLGRCRRAWAALGLRWIRLPWTVLAMGLSGSEGEPDLR